MRRLKLYIAASLDGYIAGPNGEIDWLDVAGDLDYGYEEFYASIDTTVMGRATYELTLTVEEYPYAGKTNYVFTRGPLPPDTSHVQFVSDDIAGFVRDLKEQPGEDIWLLGGGQINTIMLNEDLIDDIILTAFPLVLGEGIPLFAAGASRAQFRTVGFEAYETGLTQWRLIRP
ncbi:MAG: Dihydrofolate reductase [Chloroflexi bacterium]|jgi:dihydrofolate reductase|nr:MAG: Dihydrofolate reductase [Chloroflexota bacterium]